MTDTDAAMAKVTELGGRVVDPPRDTPYGRIGVVADNHGAVFSLITPPARLVLNLSAERAVVHAVRSAVVIRSGRQAVSPDRRGPVRVE